MEKLHTRGNTMTRKTLWASLFSGGRGPKRPTLRLQALGLDEQQIRALRPLCDRLGKTLDLLVELDARQGDIVLADRSYAARTAPQQLASICDARPLVTCDLDDGADLELTTLARFERRQRELLRQLREIPLVRGVSSQFGASGWDHEVLEASELPSGFGDSSFGIDAPRFDAAQEMLVTWLLRGLLDPQMKPMTASYGAGAVIRVDFSRSFALVDPLAQQHLRVRRELPRLVGLESPGPDAIERDLDSLVWDLGIAAGQHRLLNQPADWWNTPLATCKDPAVQRYTRLPRHLELAAVLFNQRITPAELQRQTGMAVSDMRPFLQACLFLGLCWWSPDQ
jgi:hypothetical protein